MRAQAIIGSHASSVSDRNGYTRRTPSYSKAGNEIMYGYIPTKHKDLTILIKKKLLVMLLTEYTNLLSLSRSYYVNLKHENKNGCRVSFLIFHKFKFK